LKAARLHSHHERLMLDDGRVRCRGILVPEAAAA
jgi:hypothetical protein